MYSPSRLSLIIFGVFFFVVSQLHAELILDNPEGNWAGNESPNEGGLSINESPQIVWPAQKFSVSKPTIITQVEAYIRRRAGNEDPNIAIYTDDGGDPGENGLSLPDERVFTATLPVPLGDNADFAWHSTEELNSRSILPGTYWLAITSDWTEPEFQFIGAAGSTNDPTIDKGPFAIFREQTAIDENGNISNFLGWELPSSPTHVSLRIHGEPVPEPATGSLFWFALAMLAMGYGYRSDHRC